MLTEAELYVGHEMNHDFQFFFGVLPHPELYRFFPSLKQYIEQQVERARLRHQQSQASVAGPPLTEIPIGVPVAPNSATSTLEDTGSYEPADGPPPKGHRELIDEEASGVLPHTLMAGPTPTNRA